MANRRKLIKPTIEEALTAPQLMKVVNHESFPVGQYGASLLA